MTKCELDTELIMRICYVSVNSVLLTRSKSTVRSERGNTGGITERR